MTRSAKVGHCAARSFDHLVGPGEQRRWYFNAKRFRGFEIDDYLVFRRRLHRKVGRFFTFEDTINVTRCAAVLIGRVCPVRGETAGTDKRYPSVNGRQTMPSRKRDDQFTMGGK